jgi:hypothetical protein
MLGPFSQPMAIPCRVSTKHSNPAWPEEVPEKVITGHTSHTSKGPMIASPGYCRNTTFTQYRNPLTKMVSKFNSTNVRQFPTQKAGVCKVLCSFGKVYTG